MVDTPEWVMIIYYELMADIIPRCITISYVKQSRQNNP
jgi:hypothetical protein